MILLEAFRDVIIFVWLHILTTICAHVVAVSLEGILRADSESWSLNCWICDYFISVTVSSLLTFSFASLVLFLVVLDLKQMNAFSVSIATRMISVESVKVLNRFIALRALAQDYLRLIRLW